MRFIARYIGSVEDLNVLITCIREPDRRWDSLAIGSELGISEEAALRTFERLARHNLLDVRVTEAVRYRFAPATQDVEQRARAFADAYWTNPLAVTQHVASVARRDIRDFADAFRIRRDDDI
jgi:hypothetical protein